MSKVLSGIVGVFIVAMLCLMAVPLAGVIARSWITWKP